MEMVASLRLRPFARGTIVVGSTLGQHVQIPATGYVRDWGLLRQFPVDVNDVEKELNH
jgi:hypothetical protein